MESGFVFPSERPLPDYPNRPILFHQQHAPGGLKGPGLYPVEIDASADALSPPHSRMPPGGERALEQGGHTAAQNVVDVQPHRPGLG